MNALGIYLLVSLTFLVGNILEFAAIMFLQRRQDLAAGKKVERKANPKTGSALYDIKTLSAKVDGMAMIIFLLGYLLFNMIYWAMFLDKI